jgi:hypothetical protein
MTGDPLCNPKPNHRRPVPDLIEIEATHDFPVPIDEYVIRASAGLLFGQELTMPLRELRKELVAAIADRLAEIAPVRQLESQDRLFVISAKTL